MMVHAARPEDAEAIVAFWNPMIRETAITFSNAEKTPLNVAGDIAAKAEAGYPFLVHERDGQVQGFATYGPFRGGPGYARTMEHTIILAPQARGRGAGRALMAALETAARQAGVHSLIAGISGENPAAIRFHRRLGFSEVGNVAQAGWKFGRWMDLILLQKLLEPPADNAAKSR